MATTKRELPSGGKPAASKGPIFAQFSTDALNEIARADVSRTLRRDVRELYEFYLDGSERQRLSSMHPVKRWLSTWFWLLQGLIRRLAPARRLLVVGAIVLSVIGPTGQGYSLSLGFLTLLLVLVLELKDKLLAQDELAVGRAVQSALMPPRSPHFPGWELWLYSRPAAEVGGDLVDYQVLDQDRLSVALGDVSGKGLGAALLMAQLQATVRTLVSARASLADLGVDLNRLFRHDHLKSRFASLVCCVVGSDNGEVRLLNAGHLPPVVLRARGFSALPRGGPALGVVAAPTYAEQTVTLAPGETLVIYSDGLTDSRDDDGQLFGEDRLRAALDGLTDLDAASIGVHVLAAVERFVGVARAADDLSMAILRRAPMPPPGA